MNSKTLTLHLPSFYDRSLESDRASLSLLRAALVVGEHVVEHRCRYDGGREPLRQTAVLLRAKLQEVLGFLDVYELKLNLPPSEEIPF
jgi:hypothetical protein